MTSAMPSMPYSRAPGLGLVLHLLKTSTADFFHFHQSHRQSLGKLQSLEQLPPEELKEVCSGRLCSATGGFRCCWWVFFFSKCDPVFDFVLAAVSGPGVGPRRCGENLVGPEEPPGQETSGPADQQQSQAVGALLMYPSPLFLTPHHLQTLCTSSALTLFPLDVIETCLFVLWRHLEYYLLHCTPSDPKDSVMPGAALFRSRLADSTEGSFTSFKKQFDVTLNSSAFLVPASFSGFQASGGRGLSLSRVSQQDLDLVIGFF